MEKIYLFLAVRQKRILGEEASDSDLKVLYTFSSVKYSPLSIYLIS